MAYKPGYGPLPGTSSTGNTTAMPKVNKPAQRYLNSKNVNPKSSPAKDPGRRPGPSGVITRSVPGGRVQPKVPKPSNASKAAKKAVTADPLLATPGQLPTAPDLTPEDSALQANYDPSQLNFQDNTQIAGLAGKLQLPNAINYANSMANLQYGNKIQQIAGRIKGLTAALPGSLEALNKAFANVEAQRAIVAPVTSGAGVANLFGGNTGAAALAANGAQQAQATADNQAGIASDHTQANATRQADWATRIQLLNNMAVNQGRTDLAGAVGERDNAKKGYYDQGLKMRGDMISQAIGNQGALNNQRIATALAGGQLEGQGLTNAAKLLQNQGAGIQNAALPSLLQNQIIGGKQDIINSVTQNNLTVAAAKAQLAGAKSSGVDSLKTARAAGGDAALYGMILPTGAVVQNAANGSYQLNGNPNQYFKLGVNNIMQALPKSDRKRVEQFVSNKIQQALQTTGGWKYSNGKYVKVKK